MLFNNTKLDIVVRIIFTIITGLLLVLGLFSAQSYNQSTYGCRPDDYIAPDPFTAIITLVISLMVGALFLINLLAVLKKDTTQRFYTKYWFQIISLVMLFGVWFMSGITSPKFWSGWCF